MTRSWTSLLLCLRLRCCISSSAVFSSDSDSSFSPLLLACGDESPASRFLIVFDRSSFMSSGLASTSSEKKGVY